MSTGKNRRRWQMPTHPIQLRDFLLAGGTLTATVRQSHDASLMGSRFRLNSRIYQRLGPADIDGAGLLIEQLRASQA